jgi:hypothetical protein
MDKYEGLKTLTIEPHGNGYALYIGRDLGHHGANIAYLSEIDLLFRSQVIVLIADAPKLAEQNKKMLDMFKMLHFDNAIKAGYDDQVERFIAEIEGAA